MTPSMALEMMWVRSSDTQEPKVKPTRAIFMADAIIMRRTESRRNSPERYVVTASMRADADMKFQ
jgi:hypothetical protein